MENDPAPPETPKPTPPIQTRDPLIRYSVFAALGCAALCMIFTILYIFSYSLDSTLSFERHFDSYLAAGNTANLPTVLGLHMAQNRMFLQSCGMVAGIFFAFLGLALFLVGIQGTVDASGEVRDYSTSVRRLAPGGVILLASMIFVGASAMHPIDFELGPSAFAVPSASTVPAIAAPPAQPTPQSPAAPTPSTQSQAQPATSAAVPQPAHLAPQSAQLPARPTIQLPAILQPQPVTASQPTTPIAQPTPATTRRPAQRLTLVRVNQHPATPQSPAQHRFQP
jgi:hypothetical protein